MFADSNSHIKQRLMISIAWFCFSRQKNKRRGETNDVQDGILKVSQGTNPAKPSVGPDAFDILETLG